MEFETLILKKEDHIARLTLNRPQSLNAMNVKMFDEIVVALENISQDKDIRVLVLTGAGKAFCAGADVKSGNMSGEGIPPGSSAEFMRQHLLKKLLAPVRMLFNMEMPTIAMINGVTCGGGFDWALACDMRVGSENARFMVAYTRVGLFPDGGGTWLMPRVIGLAKSFEMVYTGDFVEAAEAYRVGILNKLVPATELEKETMALAQKIAANPPLALRLAKLQMHKALLWDMETAFEVEAGFVPIVMTSKDHKEAVSSFAEKRKPTFTGE